MKYTPKLITKNFNVSKVSPLIDFFELVVKILVLFVITYIVLGLFADYISQKISPETEKKLAKVFYPTFSIYADINSDAEKELNSILKKLLANAENLPPFDYKVFVLKKGEINALALPGGNIVVYEKLLENVKTEEGRAMILAHELGHFAHKDHLRGLGRNLVFLLFSMILFGENSKASELVSRIILTAQMRFSQKAEIKADLYALNLVKKTYENKDNFLELYEKISKEETALHRFFYFFSTHPSTVKRYKILKEKLNNP